MSPYTDGLRMSSTARCEQPTKACPLKQLTLTSPNLRSTDISQPYVPRISLNPTFHGLSAESIVKNSLGPSDKPRDVGGVAGITDFVKCLEVGVVLGLPEVIINNLF